MLMQTLLKIIAVYAVIFLHYAPNPDGIVRSEYNAISLKEISYAQKKSEKYEDIPQKLDSHHHSELLIDNDGESYATAFAISRRTLLTNYHAVSENKIQSKNVDIAFDVYTDNNILKYKKAFPVIRIIKIPKVDAALLILDADISHYTDIHSLSPQMTKDPVMISGFKEDSRNIMTRYNAKTHIVSKNTATTLLDFDLQNGQSGSPVIQNDRVVGIATFSVEKKPIVSGIVNITPEILTFINNIHINLEKEGDHL